MSGSREQHEASHLPTMLTIADGYRIYDPAGLPDDTFCVNPSDGKITTTRDSWHGGFVLLFTPAFAAGTALLLGSTGRSYIILTFFGLVVGFAIAAFIVDAFSAHPERDYRKSHGGVPYVTVRRDDDLAHRLCQLADEIAATRAWQQGVVDPDRTLGATAWAAARRAVGLGPLAERLREETARGTAEETLVGLRDEIATTTAELEEVRRNLTDVATTARSLDATTGSAALPGDRPVETELAERLAAQTRVLHDLL